ncbi:MAG: SMP-30/gluconolactonase/LRE family protein [Pseudomonadota bacterium]
MTDFDVRDASFEAILKPGASVERLASGMTFTEGPIWIEADQALLFSDIPASRIMRWSRTDGLSVWREPSNQANGNYLDHQARLVTCEHESRAVTRTETDGSITVLADRWDGKRLNSPNDLVVDRTGAIWFTDPPYGLPGFPNLSAQEQAACNVFRLDPETGEMVVATDTVFHPNGLCFTLDERHLYVGNSSEDYRQIMRFAVNTDRSLSAGEVFAQIEVGVPDGMRIDEQNRLFCTGKDAIYVYRPDGMLTGKIFIPEMATNCCFGGPDRSTLFVTAVTSLYAIDLNTRGHQRP